MRRHHNDGSTHNPPERKYKRVHVRDLLAGSKSSEEHGNLADHEMQNRQLQNVLNASQRGDGFGARELAGDRDSRAFPAGTKMQETESQSILNASQSRTTTCARELVKEGGLMGIPRHKISMNSGNLMRGNLNPEHLQRDPLLTNQQNVKVKSPQVDFGRENLAGKNYHRFPQISHSFTVASPGDDKGDDLEDNSSHGNGDKDSGNKSQFS